MRLSKRETGNANRSTLEELLRGNIAGLPEVVQPSETVPEEYAWATTDYLYDITQEYYQVIQETTTSASGSTTTAYVYGLERIVAYSADSTTSYVYDGRGSVVQAITAPVAGNAVTSALPDVAVQVQSFAYTAYGEQMGSQKVSGFAYNAEAYDAVTGMINLRARQYEPAICRFSQKDVLKGTAYHSISQNRYVYCINNPVNYGDFDGRDARALVKDIQMADGGVGGMAAVGIIYTSMALTSLFKDAGERIGGIFKPKTATSAAQSGKTSGKTETAGTQSAASSIAVPTVDIPVPPSITNPKDQAKFDETANAVITACVKALSKANDVNNKYTGGTQIHHIVPQNHPDAGDARYILENIAGIKVKSDERNKVQLKTQFHKYLNNYAYTSAINYLFVLVDRIAPESSKEEAIETTLEGVKRVLTLLNNFSR